MELKKNTRTLDGLIEGLSYTYNEEGFIDWRKMIKPEFLVPNKQNFEKANKSIPSDIDGLEDKDLLILLPGFKYLARIRGYNSVEYVTESPDSSCVIATCSISWIPNYETENRSIKFSAIGDANTVSTSGFGKIFLGPIAENRAFVRCVRNFLNINILGQDELSSEKLSEEPNQVITSAAAALQKKMNERRMTFDNIKAQLVKDNYPDADKLTSINDLPTVKIFEIIDRLNKISSRK